MNRGGDVTSRAGLVGSLQTLYYTRIVGGKSSPFLRRREAVKEQRCICGGGRRCLRCHRIGRGHRAPPPRGSDLRVVVARACVLQQCARALVKSLGSYVYDVYGRGIAAAPSTRVIGIKNIFGGYKYARTHTCVAHTPMGCRQIRGEKKRIEEKEKKMYRCTRTTRCVSSFADLVSCHIIIIAPAAYGVRRRSFPYFTSRSTGNRHRLAGGATGRSSRESAAGVP
ncbi:hypothetical protein QTP88_007097 [Uroleucon formosanum]